MLQVLWILAQSKKKNCFIRSSCHSEQRSKALDIHVPMGSTLHFHLPLALSSHKFLCHLKTFLVLSHLKVYAFLISSVWIVFSLHINKDHSPLTFSYSENIKIFSLIFFPVYGVCVGGRAVVCITSNVGET